MRVLVTGATGFVGENLVRHLAARGDDVRVLVLPDGPAEVLEGLPVEVATGDLTTPATLSLVRRRKPPVTPEFLRLLERPRLCSSERAVRDLGYRRTPLRSSLEKAYRWYRERGWLE